MLFIDKYGNETTFQELKKNIKGRDCFLWGNSSNNVDLFDVVSPSTFKGIFDNNKDNWGKEDGFGHKICKVKVSPDIVIVSAMGDPYSDLLPQLLELGVENFYFFRTTKLLERYERLEYSVQKKSANNFLPNITKFRYVHIINDEKFIRNLFYVYSKGWNLKEHAFVINYFNRCNDRDVYNLWKLYIQLDEKYNNILVFDGIFNVKFGLKKRQECLSELLRNASKIIFQGEYIPLSISLVLKKNLDLIRKKGIFIPWCSKFGIDYKIKQNVEDYLRYCPVIVLNKFGDKRRTEIDSFCKFVSAKFVDINLSYVYPIEIPPKKKKNNCKPKVIISHSCFEYNKCIESIDVLLPYKGEIDVYCIGSYGDEKYIKEVNSYGKKVLDDSFHFIDYFMDNLEYSNFINQMDCAVISMTQGAGMTTLQMLFYFGVKVFIVKNSNTDIFTKSRGYKTFDIREIGEISVRDFVENNIYKENNYEIAKTNFDLKIQIEKWKKIFEEI